MRKLILLALYLALAVILGFLLVALPYYFAYKDKSIPGVFLNEVALGNKSHEQTLVLVDKYLSAYKETPISLIIDGQKLKVSQEEFGLKLDSEGTVKTAFGVGRQGNIFERLYESYQAWYKGTEINPAYIFDENRFEKSIKNIAEKIDKQPIQATFEWREDELRILPSSRGKKLEKERLASLVISSLESLDFRTLAVPTRVVEAKITENDLEALKEEVLDLITHQPVLRDDSRTWTPTPERVLSFLKAEKNESSGEIEFRQAVDPLKNYFASLATQIDVPAKAGVFYFDGQRVTEFELGENGRALNVDKASSHYFESLFSIKEVVEIQLPVEITTSKGGANDYGIQKLLGEGATNFKGSSSGRIHNIGLASSRLRGILVPPGEVFSFNSSVGEINAETGYDQAYIIRDRRTILGTGGGVCQVSTTLFRAAFNAGLPMVERYPHSYRVHYYEPPMGLDATVYAPYTDLKFKNDTPNHILIFSYFDPKTYALSFRIFGTDDGREVKIEGPIVHSQTPAPEPLYQEDPSLAPGQIKQIDFASPGARVTVERLVVRAGETLIDEKFHSNYSPWQAVYLVGPSEDN